MNCNANEPHYKDFSSRNSFTNDALIPTLFDASTCKEHFNTLIIKILGYQFNSWLTWLNVSGNFQNRNLGPNAWDMLSHIYYVPTSDNTEHYDSTMEYYDDNTTMEYYEDNANLKYQEDLTNVSDLNVSFDQPCELQQCPCEMGLNHLSSTPI